MEMFSETHRLQIFEQSSTSSTILRPLSSIYLEQELQSFEAKMAEMDLFPNEQNFDLGKSRQKFHHSLKEHHEISNIPKFRCEML
jgi:hypothetical protein